VWLTPNSCKDFDSKNGTFNNEEPPKELKSGGSIFSDQNIGIFIDLGVGKNNYRLQPDSMR
jgi:hypothetical protein